MTLREFERIVLLLSKQGWIRHWIHWNYPQESPWEMALSFSDGSFEFNLKSHLGARGFRFEMRRGHEYAVVTRIRKEV